jgi:hypothetical protein
MDPAAELLAHRPIRYLDRLDPASPEALVALAGVLVAALLALWWATRRMARGRPRA